MREIKKIVSDLYPNHENDVLTRIDALLEKGSTRSNIKRSWDQEDVVLITYADVVTEQGQKPLETFKKLQELYLKDHFSHLHFLPFYPYSSDDGFSVIDYYKINPELGDWDMVSSIQKDNRLMFDFVCNHMSKHSDWFKKYLKNDTKYRDYFIDVDPNEDYSSITRPRTSDLFHPFKTVDGQTRYVWTTFSEDQVDLNFRSPNVMIEMLEILAFYIDKGADYIRLDAVGFLWKTLGTSSMHLKETHQIIQLMRSFVDKYAPGVVLITETNVPHVDNISYFGDGYNEAQMVYQFTLPPLLLYTLHTSDVNTFKHWLESIETPSEETSFFNFLASHDGIGLNPVRGILEEEKILDLVKIVKNNGAKVSYKKNPDGSESPYEINVTYLDAIKRKGGTTEENIQRFMLSHAILLSLPGVPAIYFNSYFACENDLEGVAEKGYARAINREKFAYENFVEQIEAKQAKTIREKMNLLLQVRRLEEAFHPNAYFEVKQMEDEEILCFVRKTETSHVKCFYNFSNETKIVEVDSSHVNMLSKEKCLGKIELEPYAYRWLKKENEK